MAHTEPMEANMTQAIEAQQIQEQTTRHDGRFRQFIKASVAMGTIAATLSGCSPLFGDSPEAHRTTTEAQLAANRFDLNPSSTTTTEVENDPSVCPEDVFPAGPWEASNSKVTDTPDALHWSPARGEVLDTKDKLMSFFFTGDQTACRSAATLGTLEYLILYLNGAKALSERGLDTTISLQDMVDHLVDATDKVRLNAVDEAAKMVESAELNNEDLNGKWYRFVKEEILDADGNVVKEVVKTQLVDLATLGGVPAGSVWLASGEIKDDSGQTGGINHQFFITKAKAEIWVSAGFAPESATTTTTSTTSTTTTTEAPAQPNKHGKKKTPAKPIKKKNGIPVPVNPVTGSPIPVGSGTENGGGGTGTGTGGTGTGGTGTGGTGEGTPTTAPHSPTTVPKGPEVTIPGAPN